LNVQELIEDPKFKSAISKELKEMDVDSIDLRPMIREYIALLASVNEKLRERVSEPIINWNVTVRSTILKFSQGDESRESLLRLEIRNELGETTDHVYINHGAFKRHQRLINLYRGMTGLASRFVSSRPPKR
jgi:hypothetical protein